MSDLKLDLSGLADLYSELVEIKTAFDGADGSARDVADDVGDEHLAGKIQDFATTWDDRREKMSEALQTMTGTVQAIHDAFKEVDMSLASSLTGGGSSDDDGS